MDFIEGKERTIRILVEFDNRHKKPDPPHKEDLVLTGIIKLVLEEKPLINGYQFDWEKFNSEDSIQLNQNPKLEYVPCEELIAQDHIGGWLVAHLIHAAITANNWRNKVIEESYTDRRGRGLILVAAKKEASVRSEARLSEADFKFLTEFCEEYGTKTKLSELTDVKSERLACGPYCETHGGAWPSDSIPDDNAKRQVHIDTCEEHGIENCQSCHR